MKQPQALRALRFKVFLIAVTTGFILLGLILYVSVHLATLSKAVGSYSIQLNQLSVLLLAIFILSAIAGIWLTFRFLKDSACFFALEESEARVRAMVDSAIDGFITLGEAGKIETYSLVAEDLLGYSAEEVMGKTLDMFMIEPYCDEYKRDISGYLTGTDKSLIGTRKDITGLRKDGSTFPMHFAVSEMHLEGEHRVVVIVRDISRRKYAEELLRLSEQRFSKAFHASPDPVSITRLRDGCLVDVNESFLRASGYSRDEVLGRGSVELGLWDSESERDRLLTELKIRGSVRDFECVFYSKAREPRTTLTSAELLEIDGEQCVLVTAHDITERKRAQEALFEEKERAQITLYSIADAVITTDATGKIEYLNPVAEQLTGWSCAEAKGLTLGEVYISIDEISRQREQSPLDRYLSEGAMPSLFSNSLLISRDGRETAIEDSAAPIRNRAGEIIGAVLVCHDVSQARKMANQMSYQASHDSLTGLVNRREFERRLQKVLNEKRGQNIPHALCYLDLDQFKVVNDTCGHNAGDELLRQLTHMLLAMVRETDTLARLGGDEFGLLLENCPLDRAEYIAELVRQVVNDFRFVWHDKTFAVGVSIGLVPFTGENFDLAAVFSAADAACYSAKDKGRNRVWVYQAEDSEVVQRFGEMQWVQHIKNALDENRFELYCQEIIPASGANIESRMHEILVRLLDANGRLVPPMAFIPAADRYSLMPTVDRWVVSTVFSSLRNNPPKSGLNGDVYMINISGASLSDPAFIEFVLAQQAQAKIDPQLICFEIPESAIIANLNSAMHFMHDLKKVGFLFSLDDFGNGLSSATYLKSLPIDFLKIDGGFIRDMGHDPIDYAMVEAMNKIGHVMGIKTVAKHVESQVAMESLEKIGVDYIQGFAIARPKPLEDLLGHGLSTAQNINGPRN